MQKRKSACGDGKGTILSLPVLIVLNPNIIITRITPWPMFFFFFLFENNKRMVWSGRINDI